MSSLPPPSYIDDNPSFTTRVPHPRSTRPVEDLLSSTTSVYTGSYYDDGADMLAASSAIPGFGTIDKRFYKQRKKKIDEGPSWNEDIRRAVQGDIRRSLGVVRGVGVDVWKNVGGRMVAGEEEGIRIGVPRKWGTFVIRGDDGRVIVVDEDGEFDSGPVQTDEGEKEGRKADKRGKWVRAKSVKTSRSGRGRERTRNRQSGPPEEIPAPPLKPLPSIPETQHEEGYIMSDSENSASPTGFFMTGGASGWPSADGSSLASPFETPAALARKSSRQSHSTSASTVKGKAVSPVHSPLGSWRSPAKAIPQSRSGYSSGRGSDGERWGEAWNDTLTSRKSGKSKQRDFDNGSTKTRSTYRPPMVENAPETSCEPFPMFTENPWDAGWHSNQPQDNQQNQSSWQGKGQNHPSGVRHSHAQLADAISGHQSSRQSTSSTADSSRTASDAESIGRGPSIQNWVDERVKTISETSDRGREHHRSNSNHHNKASSRKSTQASSGSSTSSWDGYERPKAVSEVASVGSQHSDGRVRSDTSSGQNEVRTPHRSHRTRGSRASHRSFRNDRSDDDARSNYTSDWNGSQRASVGVLDYETETETEREDPWNKSEVKRQHSRSRYANGYDEDNGTYLNATWDGVAVRVDSRRTSAAGWDN